MMMSSRIISVLRQKDPAELRKSMQTQLDFYHENIEPALKKQGVDMEMVPLNSIDPIPPFQWYSVNGYIYINPLTTICVKDTKSGHEDVANIANVTPRNTFHIKFDPNNDYAKKSLTGFERTFNYYTHANQ